MSRYIPSIHKAVIVADALLGYVIKWESRIVAAFRYLSAARSFLRKLNFFLQALGRADSIYVIDLLSAEDAFLEAAKAISGGFMAPAWPVVGYATVTGTV